MAGCQKVLFDRPMPVEATDILECPKEFDGSYISLHYDEYSVLAGIQRVDRISDFEIVVYSQQLTYIDSLYLEKLKLSAIDTAWFDDNLVHIKAGQAIQTFGLYDTLSRKDEKIEISIDFSKKLYWEAMEDTCSFKLSFIDDYYYLNIEKQPNLFSITQLKFIEDDVALKSLDFGVVDSINPTDEFIEKYQLKPIKEERGKFYVQNYLANLNNDEFYEMIHDESVFQTVIWYRIESTDFLLYWITGIIISLLLLFLISD